MTRLLITLALVASAPWHSPPGHVWPPQIEQWRPLIETHAARYALDPALVAAIVRVESNGVWDVPGPVDEVGLMQIRPFPWRPSPEFLSRPANNIRYGAAILAEILAHERGDLRRALAAYNGGYRGAAAGCCREYADRVLAYCRQFGGCRPPEQRHYFNEPGRIRAE